MRLSRAQRPFTDAHGGSIAAIPRRQGAVLTRAFAGLQLWRMARAKRLERLDMRRVEMEAEYRRTLVAALQTVAAGTWGLFGHQGDRWSRARFADVVESLTSLGDDIAELREQLGLAPFDLHRDFVASRGPVASNAPGEPKQAQAWLARLD